MTLVYLLFLGAGILFLILIFFIIFILFYKKIKSRQASILQNTS